MTGSIYTRTRNPRPPPPPTTTTNGRKCTDMGMVHNGADDVHRQRHTNMNTNTHKNHNNAAHIPSPQQNAVAVGYLRRAVLHGGAVGGGRPPRRVRRAGRNFLVIIDEHGAKTLAGRHRGRARRRCGGCPVKRDDACYRHRVPRCEQS